MNEKKIIDIVTISSHALSDMGIPNFSKGFNTQVRELIDSGYHPFGDIQITYSPTYVMPGTATTLGGYINYTQQFVKYEP